LFNFYEGIACWNLKKRRKLRKFAGTSGGSCASIKYNRTPIKRSSGQLCNDLVTLFLRLILMVNKKALEEKDPSYL